MNVPPPYVTAMEAADLLRIKPETLLGWATGGRLTAYRIETETTLYDLEEIADLIASSAQTTRPASNETGRGAKPATASTAKNLTSTGGSVLT